LSDKDNVQVAGLSQGELLSAYSAESETPSIRTAVGDERRRGGGYGVE